MLWGPQEMARTLSVLSVSGKTPYGHRESVVGQGGQSPRAQQLTRWERREGRPPSGCTDREKLEQQAGLGPSLANGTVWRAAGERDAHLESGEADRFPETMSQSPELCGVSGTKTGGMGSRVEQAGASRPLS